MDGWIKAWMDKCWVSWVDESMDGQRDKWIHEWVCVWLGCFMDGLWIKDGKMGE